MKSFLFFIFISFLVQLPVFAAGDNNELLAGGVNPGYHEKPSWFKQSFLDIQEDINEASESSKRLMLYFYQDGCPYCAKLLKDNFGNTEISEKTQQYFDVVAINMWGDKETTDLDGQDSTEKQLAEKLRVQYTPTLLFFNEEGKVVSRLDGYYAPAKFNVVVDYVGNKQESKMTLQSYYQSQIKSLKEGKVQHIAGSLSSPYKLKSDRVDSYRPLVVFFEEGSCAQCDELHNDILKRESVSKELTNFDVAVVNRWSNDLIETPNGDKMPIVEWARKIGVKHSPSMVFFDTDGVEVFRTDAFLKTFHTVGAMDYVSTQSYKKQPNFQRYLKYKTDALHARGFKVDLMD